MLTPKRGPVRPLDQHSEVGLPVRKLKHAAQLIAHREAGYHCTMTMRSHYGLRGAYLLALLVLTLGSTGLAQAERASATISVAVSLQPWASIVEQIGGDRVEVAVLLPSGASPHSYEPSPSQVISLSRADLIVLNGGIDAWLDRLLEAAAGDASTIRLMDSVDFVRIQEVDAHDVDADDHHDGDGAANPHIWLDPVIVASAVPRLVAALEAVDAAGSFDYERNAAQLIRDLELLDSEVSNILDSVRGSAIVPFHDAWGYFARRYELDIVATLEPYAGRQPSAKYIVETVDAIQRAGVDVIFDERQLSDRTARVVAESAGVGVVTLDPIGGEPGVERYQDLILENAKAISRALRR